MIMALSPSRRPGKWGAFLLLAAAIVMSGCGGGTSTISGTVSYDGKLLKGGNLTFVSDGKPSVGTTINKDGTYTAKSVPSGKVTIAVETESLNPGRRGGMAYKPPPGQQAPAGLASKEDTADRFVAIPPKYADPAESGLSLEVKGGSQTYNIELK
jgi:hypothetical protein